MFERLEETISSISNTVKVGATTLAGTINLNSKIDDEKKVLAKLYGELGEKVFADKKDDIPEGYEDIFAGVKASVDKIDSYKAQLKKLSGLVVCPNCGLEVSSDYTFCMACGAELPKEEPEEEPAEEVVDDTICPECGEKIVEGAFFCVHCGAKLPEKKAEEPEEEPAAEEAEAPAEEKTEE